MRVAIHQPNYLPWCGYFAKMRACDLFVFLDDVQISKGSYVPRCRVRNRQGPLWLTVPVHRSLDSLIRDARSAEGKWRRKHLLTLRDAYARCPRFAEVMALLEPLYEEAGGRVSQGDLAAFNMRLVRAVAGYLGIDCEFRVSSQLAVEGRGDDRLIALCQAVGASCYISGQGGQHYQDPGKFQRSGIELAVRVYRPIPYPQIQGEFVAGLSIVDALCHLGRNAVRLLTYEQGALEAAAPGPAGESNEQEEM